MFRLVNDDIESLYKIVTDIFDSFYKVVSVFVSLSYHHTEATMMLVV